MENKIVRSEYNKSREEIALSLIETTAKYCVLDIDSDDGKFSGIQEYITTVVKTSFLFADIFIKIRDDV